MPLTCGLVRPAIVLPADARGWNAEDVRRALIHELEHVRRHDWAIQLLGRAACAMYWFHPLVWVAWRRLCLEAERACDDAVIQTGDRTEYAEQLVALARRAGKPVMRPLLAMANRSDLSARVSALLDGNQKRGRMGLMSAAAVVTVTAGVVLAIAPVRAVPAAPRDLSAALEAAAGQGDRQRGTPFDRGLYRAAERGNLERITELLDQGANANAAIDGDGSPLIAAARTGRRAAVQLLLDRGADPDMPVPGDGSPLIAAASEGHLAIVTLLLDRGASIDQIVPGDENPLIQASGEGHLDIVKLLVSLGADVNAAAWAAFGFDRSDGEWRTPLSMARQGGHDAVVQFLLSVGARN